MNLTETAGTESEAAQPYLDAARRMAPRIREFAPAIERDRMLPAALVDEMREAGFFHLLLPRDLGGLELDPMSAARVVEEVSRADGAAGWCLMLAAQSCSFAGLMPADQARTVFGAGGIVAGTARPIGRAVAVDSPAPGFMVSGRWPFASGSSHATWFAAECIVYEGNEPRKDADGNSVSRMVFVPRESVVVHDTWNSLGLRGTASNDFSIEGAFVPWARGFQMLVDPPQHAWALYRTLPLIFINHGAQAVGVARAAIDAAIDIARSKPGWGGVMTSELPRVQAVIAEATVTVDAAAHYLYATSQQLWEAALAGADEPLLRAKVRLAMSHAVRSSLQSVDLLHGALATSAILASSPLERCFRDLHTAAAHVMIGQMTFEAGGRVLLGMDPAFPFF